MEFCQSEKVGTLLWHRLTTAFDSPLPWVLFTETYIARGKSVSISGTTAKYLVYGSFILSENDFFLWFLLLLNVNIELDSLWTNLQRCRFRLGPI